MPFQMFKYLLGLLFLLYTSLCSAQAVPPIHNFTPQDYGAEDQNWAVSQSEDQTVFVANNRGLLEYNGARWQFYPSKNNAIMRAVHVLGDKVYTGSYMDFGYWNRNDYGELKYFSLSDALNLKLIEDEEFWRILSLENWVLFQSFDRIYVYNIITDQIKVINSEQRITKVFLVGDEVFFQEMGKGIWRIENGKATMAYDNKVLKSQEVVNIFNGSDGLLFQTTEDGFYKLQNQRLKRWQVSAQNLLLNVSVYNSIRLDDNSYLLGTISNGLIHLDENGGLIQQIDEVKGLGDNTVLGVFEDAFHNIWLGLDNGISLINLKSHFRVYRDVEGVLGTVYSAALHDDKLYLGTNQGLFYKQFGKDMPFQAINNTKGQVWSLNTVNGDLFCGHDKGTFLVRNAQAILISDLKGTWCVKEIPNKRDLLIQGNYNGISVLEKSKNGWSLRNTIQGFDISSRYLEFVNNYELLVSHEYKGVFHLEVDADYERIKKFEKLAIDKGIHSSIIRSNDEIIYANEKGIFRYDDSEKTFNKDTILTNAFNNDKYISGKLVHYEADQKLWFFQNNKITYVQQGTFSNKPEVESVYLPAKIRQTKAGYECILPLEKDRYLVGNTQGYFVIDLKEHKDRNLTVKLNAVSNHLFLNRPLPLHYQDSSLILKNKNNNLQFKYSITNFNNLTPALYRYRLIGYRNQWSSWSESSEISFENLPYGDYTLEVEAKVGSTVSANTLQYKFIIKKPWVLSQTAILLYILGFILIALVVQYFNRRHYKKQKQIALKKKEKELELKTLESERQLVQYKNENLRQDIESKNRELGISTMNLIKKNELLGAIKKELTAVKDAKHLNHVIKLINKNLNTSDDWKLFEEAFNNADKDFLKRVKAKHPSLTSNDLRLCAYLRLNLSSKEIAPLLNISHRSVEVKRYRLRKKMKLDHKDNLTDYILQI